MKVLIGLLTGSLFFAGSFSAHSQTIGKNKAAVRTEYISLDGKVLSKANPMDPDGNIPSCQIPLLRLIRTKSKSPGGCILLIPGGDYALLKWKNEVWPMTLALTTRGYNVAVLDYPIAAGSDTRDLALKDALNAFILLKTKKTALGLHGDRLDIIGLSSGAQLAAKVLQQLSDQQQPDNLLLVSPAGLDEPLPGTVLSTIMPPVRPTARLMIVVADDDSSSRIRSSQEYAKIWKGYDGRATFRLWHDSTRSSPKEINLIGEVLKPAGLLENFLHPASEIVDTAVNPAAVAVEGYARQRHAEKLGLIARQKFDLILIGNSITNNFEKPEYQPVWNQFFAPRNALNLGYSGYRTENIIWNIQHGELDGQSPKVVILEIGTNNVDEKHYPTRHTAGQLAGGIKTIVALLREKVPEAKIILLRCFPGCYGGPNPTSHRAILERASEEVSGLADNQHIFYCDVNHVFLHLDGAIDQQQMPDWLHPSPAGAKAWAQTMEPLLSRLMGDPSLDKELPANSAIIPASKLEEDSYDWWARHAEVLRIKDSINPEIILIGNSITHFWGGLPALKNANGQPRNPNGPQSWAGLFGPYRVLNLGFGWDRTQNALWRLDHGELDGLHPRTVIIDIGTNNTSQTANARMNTAAEIVEGIRAVCGRVRSKTPHARIILMAIFPREQSPQHPRRILIDETNRLLAAFAKEQQLTFVNIGPQFLAPDGMMLPGLTLDFTHPTDKGYQLWADAIRPLLK